jgi:hypothetical protein
MVATCTTEGGIVNSPVRILLGEAASKALLDAGQCFIVAGRATHPDDPNRVAVHFIPCDVALANQAAAVARGEMKAKPFPTPKIK